MRKLTKLDRLIEELCPDGVEYAKLGECCEIEDNKRKPIKANNRIKGKTPYYGANNIQDYVEGFTHDGKYTLIAEDGSVSLENYSIQYVEGKFWANNHIHVVKGNTKLNTKFLYHYLTSFNFIPFLTGSTRAKLNKSRMVNIPVPLPPLPVQVEIVRILDNFTELTAELQEELNKELTARKRQYEYYRDELLTFGDEVEWKTLGESLERTKGTSITAKRMKDIDSKNGQIRIFAGGKTYADVHYGDIPDKDINTNSSIIVKSRGNIEFEYYDRPFSHKNEFWSYYSKNENINVKYIYYFLQTKIDYFQHRANTMQMPQISIPVTDKYKIPIPPLDQQERIVSILDKFDALVNDISIGLPAEIEARQKQ
ncbi:MAG: restriction endonuclease subunit S, partial [Tissierellaceae bacterium]